MEKTVFIHEDKLLRQKFVWGGPGVKLLPGDIRSVFVVLARHLVSKQQFSDDVICCGFPIEFVA
jgi:hypothetical protein